MMESSKLYLWLARHPLYCLLLMTLSFICFGWFSVDLVRLIPLNASFLLKHGWLALREGGLLQFLELWLYAFAAILAYLAFKLCEVVLVQGLAQKRRS